MAGSTCTSTQDDVNSLTHQVADDYCLEASADFPQAATHKLISDAEPTV